MSRFLKSRGGRGSRGGNGGRRGKRRAPKKSGIHPSLYVSKKQPQVEEQKDAYIGKKYADFGFNRVLSENLARKGFETTTEIQSEVIPLIMDGKDVLGISQTGSGKTGAFLIPMIEKMLKSTDERLMVVAPTRELAQQIQKEAVSLIKQTSIRSTLVIGGENMGRQIQSIKQGSDMIIGTPGRINDLIKRGNINTKTINNVIIDEVDRMFDMGFISDVQFIFGKVSPKRQSLFFSATHNNQVEGIVKQLTSSFETVKLAVNKASASVMQDIIDYRDSQHKMSLLKELLNKDEVEKAIIFVETKRYADMISDDLYKNRFSSGVIHGDKPQNKRRRIIEQFKESKIKFLVATNVAARGIDINDITHVINLDEPSTHDEYIHRIGRTGRNGNTGVAYTFVQSTVQTRTRVETTRR